MLLVRTRKHRAQRTAQRGRDRIVGAPNLTAEFMYRRDRPGFCHCGYDLRGAPHQRCPECGEISDPALRELATFCWLHYSDLEDYALTGKHALARDERRSFARAIVFLKSDREYTHNCVVWNATCLGHPAWTCLIWLGLPMLAAAIAWYWRGVVAAALLFGAAAAVVRLGFWCAQVAQRTIAYVRAPANRETPLVQSHWPFRNMIDLRDVAARGLPWLARRDRRYDRAWPCTTHLPSRSPR